MSIAGHYPAIATEPFPKAFIKIDHPTSLRAERKHRRQVLVAVFKGKISDRVVNLVPFVVKEWLDQAPGPSREVDGGQGDLLQPTKRRPAETEGQ